MAQALLKVILSFIASIVGIILAPIDLIVANAFPNLNAVIQGFEGNLGSISNAISDIVGFILNLFPYPCRIALNYYFLTLVACYTITISIHLIVKVIRIIQNIKFW